MFEAISPIAAREIRDQRIAICFDCDSLRQGSIATCKECGCPIASKTMFKFAECPIGKWGKQ